jgi:hypothetical protein
MRSMAHGDDMYKRAKPSAGDALLAIEVAESSLHRDRTILEVCALTPRPAS